MMERRGFSTAIAHSQLESRKEERTSLTNPVKKLFSHKITISSDIKHGVFVRIVKIVKKISNLLNLSKVSKIVKMVMF